MNDCQHEYEITISRSNGEECKHCGLLKTTIEASLPASTDKDWRREVENYHRRGNTNDLLYYVESLLDDRKKLVESIIADIPYLELTAENGARYDSEELKQTLREKYL